MAPPLRGHVVRFDDVGIPPPVALLAIVSCVAIHARRTWIHPLHAIGEAIGSILIVDSKRSGLDSGVRIRRGSVGVDVVSSPSWVHNDCVGRGERPAGDDKNELGESEHDGGQIQQRSGSSANVLLFLRCSGLQSSSTQSGSGRRKPAACGGGGHQHLWGARLLCNHGVLLEEPAGEWGQQNGADRTASHCMSALEALSRQRIGSVLAYWLDRGERPLSFPHARLLGREGNPQDGWGE
jgi:hypothetical protein